MCEYSAIPNIDTVLNEFLADQKRRLRPRTFVEYSAVIDLLRQSLERSTIPRDPQLADAVEKAQQQGREDAVCSLCGPDEIVFAMPEFLGWFMIRHVVAGPSFMRSTRAVVNKLSRWLAEHHYLDANSQKLSTEVREIASVLPKVATLRDRLSDWASQQPITNRKDTVVTEGRFTIEEVTAKGWKIHDMLAHVHGEIPVPPQWLDAEQVGWDVSGAVARRGAELQWVEVWNVYP